MASSSRTSKSRTIPSRLQWKAWPTTSKVLPGSFATTLEKLAGHHVQFRVEVTHRLLHGSDARSPIGNGFVKIAGRFSQQWGSYVFRIHALFDSSGRTEQCAIGIWLAGLPPLLWHGIVEFSVVEQQTTLRRNAGDVLVTMVPADIAQGIEAARKELLGGAVIDAADVEH
jgi:hypothetical protein